MSKFDHYLKANKKFFEEPIIKQFFANYSNVYLLKKAIEDGDMEVDRELNEKFLMFFLYYRLVKYIATLSKNYSVYFDKKVNSYKNRYLLSLDKPINSTGTTFIDFTENKDPKVIDQVIAKRGKLSEEISDKNLYKVFLGLTSKQKKILEMIFVYNLSQKEVAFYFGNTPQNISKLKKKALTHIQHKLKSEVKKDEGKSIQKKRE